MFKLNFKTGNAAFDDGNAEAEIQRILTEVADKVYDGRRDGTIRDVIGNNVGEWEYVVSED